MLAVFRDEKREYYQHIKDLETQVHEDTVGGSRGCGSGHLYEDGAPVRCYSRTPEVSLEVTCTVGCARRRLQPRSAERAVRRLGSEGRLVPFAVTADGQMNIHDCANEADASSLAKASVPLGADAAKTDAWRKGLGSPELAISYNPTLDYFAGTSIPLVDASDASYCILYVMGQKRFVYCKPGYMPGSENRSVAPTPRDPRD